RDKADWMVVCQTKARRVIDEFCWIDIAYQPEKVVLVPEVARDNQMYDLYDPDCIQIIVDLSITHQQGAGTLQTQHVQIDNEEDEDNEDTKFKHIQECVH
ncbi:UNVERIFIED_CONTAM: hypothetical protein Sradi_1301700, partial [Sesamum radiatum]